MNQTKAEFSDEMMLRHFKGIVSRDLGTLFLISLDRFEGHYRAGSGLFFILMI
jgi:hypothetical protein